MEPKEEPAPLHIRVVQRMQPSETLTDNLGIEYSQRQDDLDIVQEANIAEARGWKGLHNDAVYDLAKFAVRFISQ
jgi:hypothetical protein